MMSADMTSTLSPSMPVLTRISPDASARSYARNKLYARPPTLQLTAPSHAAAADSNATHRLGAVPVRAAPGTRDELTQSVIKLAVTVKSGVKTVTMAPEPKVLMVRVEDAVRLGRLESQSNGRYRMRQEPRELQAPATHKQAHQHVEGAKIPGLTDMTVHPEGVSVETPVVCVAGQNVSEDADSGPPTLTMDDYHAKLTEEKGRMINRVFARIASVSNSHEDQQKSFSDSESVDVIRQPEYEDISDAEDFARDAISSETQHDLQKLPQVSPCNYSAETDAANQQKDNDANNSELLRVLEGTDSLVGGTEISPRRQVFARRTSAPELNEGTPSRARVPLLKTTRSASLPGAGDAMDDKLCYPKMLISRCSRTNWRVVDKPSPSTPDVDDEAVATHSSRRVSMEDGSCESPAAASQGGEESANDVDCPSKGGKTCVTEPTDVSVIVQTQGGSVGDMSSNTEASCEESKLLQHLEPAGEALPILMSLPQGPVDVGTVRVVDGKSASVKQVESNPDVLLTTTSNGERDRVNSDAVRRLSEEKCNARPEVISTPNGVVVAKLPPATLSTPGGSKPGTSQREEVETIAGTEIPVLNDLGLGTTKEPSRKRGRPPLHSHKKDAKTDDAKPSPPKMIIARKKSTSRRNFRHESIQTFKPTTAPPPWRYKGRAHVRSPDITQAPQRKLSVDLRVVETEIGPVSSPSPNELVIDLNPGSASEAAGGEQEVVDDGAGVGASPTTQPVLMLAISGPGDSSAAVGPSQTAAVSSETRDATNETGSLDFENADCGKKKRRKEEGDDVIQTVHARVATKKLNEKGRRLAQELPGYNWLEEKILNGGVPPVLPPKIVVPATPATPATPVTPVTPVAPVAPVAATAEAAVPCASDIPEVAKRLASVTENLVITKVIPNVQPNGISGVLAASIDPVNVQKPAVAHQVKSGEPMQSGGHERHDSVARRTLIQLTNGGDVQVTMERIPPQNPSAVNYDLNDMRRHEESFVAKQMLQDFNAKNQMNQENKKRMESLQSQQRNFNVDLSGAKASPASWGFAENVATMARHTAMSFDTGVALSRGYPGPLPQISPPSNFRNANGMGSQRSAATASSTHCGGSTLPALPQGSTIASAPQLNAQPNGLQGRIIGEQSRKPQFPPEMYRPHVVLNGSPSHAAPEAVQKLSDTADGYRQTFYEDHKRGIHPRPAVPTATAAATAMSSFPSPPGSIPTQPQPPTRRKELPGCRQGSSIHHQEPPGRHQDPLIRHQGSSIHHQEPPGRHQDPLIRHQGLSIHHQEPPGRHQDPLIRHQGSSIHHQEPPGRHQDPLIRHQVSSIHHQEPPGRHQDPLIRHQGSSIHHQEPPGRHQDPLIRHQGSSIHHQEPPGRHQDPLIRHQVSSIHHQEPPGRHQDPLIRHQVSSIHHQEPPGRHQDPLIRHQGSSIHHQDPPRPLPDPRTNPTNVEQVVVTKFLQGNPYPQNQNFMQISRSPEAYGGTRNGTGNIGVMLNAPNYMPTRFLKQTLTDGSSRMVQETVVPGGPTAPSHRSPQAAPQIPAKETNYPFAPMPQLKTYPNLSPEALNQLRFEQWRSGQPGPVGSIHPARADVIPANVNPLNPPQTSPQERATVHRSNINFHDGPLNQPFQLPPFSPPFTSIPGQTAPRPQAPFHQKSGNHAGLVRPTSPQNSLPSLVPNLRQQIPGNFQPQSQPTRYARNIPNERLEYLQQTVLRFQLKEQEFRLKQLAQLAAIQKEEQRQKATQREIARLEVAKEKAIQEARHEEERLRAEQHAADFAVHCELNQRGALQHEQPVIHTQESWNQHRQFLRQQITEKQTVSPRSMHSQPVGPQQRMSGGQVSPRQQMHPQNFGAQPQANNQIMQVLQRQQKSPHSDVLLMQQQKQNSPLSQQASVQISAPLVEEIHQHVRNHEHRIHQQQQQQSQQLNKRPLVGPTAPSQPLNSPLTIGGNGGNEKSSRTEHVEPPIPQPLNVAEKLQEFGKQARETPIPGNNGFKVFLPLLPLPESPKVVHVLEEVLADKEDSQTTSNSDRRQQSPVASGGTDSSSSVEHRASSADTSEVSKYLPQAHQASLFSTATIKSGKRNPSHSFSLSPGNAVVHEPMDLSASKEKTSDPEKSQSPLNIVSRDVVSNLQPTIHAEKLTETLADNLLLQPKVQLQSKMVTINEIKEKRAESQQDAPFKTEIVEKSILNRENQSRLRYERLPASRTSRFVDIFSKLAANIEQFEGNKKINRPSVANEKNQSRVLQKQDTALTADVPIIGNCTFDDDDSNEVMFVKAVTVNKSSTGGAQSATAQPSQVVVYQEPRFRSYSDSDLDKKIKDKFRTVKPINSQDDQDNSIQGKTIVGLESGITPGNSVAVNASISRAHLNILPYNQLQTTSKSENVASNESQRSMPSKNDWIKVDGNQNLLKLSPSKVCQTRVFGQNSPLVMGQTSEQHFRKLNDPTVKNVIAGGVNSHESECNIKIADIFSITNINEDGSYDPLRPGSAKVYQKPKLDENCRLVSELTAKKLTKQRSLPNQIAQPLMICSRDGPVQKEAQRQIERSSIRAEEGNECHVLARSVLVQGGANVCQKRKLVAETNVSWLEEEPVARKIPKQTSASNDSASLDTVKSCQKLVLAEIPLSVSELEPTTKKFDHQSNLSRQTMLNQNQLNNLEGVPAAQSGCIVENQAEASPQPNVDFIGEQFLGNNDLGVMCLLCGLPASCSCSKCQAAHYCSRVCQVNHWGIAHSNQCKLWAKQWGT